MRNNLFPISKEGWGYVAYSILAFVIFAILDLEVLTFISFLAAAFFIFVFRNPERLTQVFQDNSVVSPVDGVVLSIEEIDNHEEFLYKVEIDCNYQHVSVLRAPLTSTVHILNKKKGAKLSRFSPLSKKINENTELLFSDKNNNTLKVLHTLTQSFDSINIDAIEAQKYMQGTRYGVMVKGVTTIFLPQNFRLDINVGNELIGSETLIGYFS
ncbi:phosphatidylserine decarboxylase [bacterium]|nr:phosphatidylserine decarboxylase [bacterium]MBU1994159.1 phosphatidylserine decarboxylase [bacterium]